MKEKQLYEIIKGYKLFPAPVKTTRPADSAYEFIIGIGKDHIARITIAKDAYEALVGITTPD